MNANGGAHTLVADIISKGSFNKNNIGTIKSKSKSKKYLITNRSFINNKLYFRSSKNVSLLCVRILKFS